MNQQQLWKIIVEEAQTIAASEPLLARSMQDSIIQQPSLVAALGKHLARLLNNSWLPEETLQSVIQDVFAKDSVIVDASCKDILACRERDAACSHYLSPLLYFKGFHALQTYRIAHHLYQNDQCALAYFFQNLMAQHFAVDIHPAARIGAGILFDHATGVVIGETAVIEDNVSLLHGVTLGGSGIDRGKDRHPKIRRGVLLSAGAKVLGPVEVGEGAKVAAGSLVLEDVAPHTTVAGIPAKVVGKPMIEDPALSMNHELKFD